MAQVNQKRGGLRMAPLKQTIVILKNHAFQINDISSGGMGLIMQNDGPQMVTGEQLKNISLPLKDGDVNLKGVVTHISITSKTKICGIRFLFSGEEFKSVMQLIKERTAS